MKPTFSKWPNLCGCCRRTAMCVGYSPSDRKPIMWLCGTKPCTDIADKVYHMKSRIIEECEKKARDAAAAIGVQYLQEIGKTDIWTLDADEHDAYMRRMLDMEKIALVKELTAISPY